MARLARTLAGLALCAGLLSCACSDDAPGTAEELGEHAAPSTASPDHGATTEGDTYTGVRGVVVSVPETGNPASDLRIHHEHIPHFRNREGVVNVSADGVTGMKAMVMPFPIAEGLDVSDLQAGDVIAFDFVVTWGTPPYFVTRYEKLDPATEVDFSNKPADAQPETP